MKLVPYSREVFRRWLLSRLKDNPRKPVGMSCGSDVCPLSNCFGQAVDERGYRIPKWADEYIWQQDAIFSDGKVRRIYPRRALSILDAIPRSL